MTLITTTRSFDFSLRPGLLASAVSMALLSGCGGSNSSNSDSVTKAPVRCSDWNLNANCESYEMHKQAALASEGKNGPYLIPGNSAVVAGATNRQGFLSAPDGAKLLTPFTTLIANELLFNPKIPGLKDAQPDERLDQAVDYLNEKFPSLDFSRYLFQQGPTEQGAQITASIDRALASVTNANPYCVVAAVVDAMVIKQSFDVTINAAVAKAQCPAPGVSADFLNNILSDYRTIGISEQQDIIVTATSDELTVWSNDELSAKNANAITTQSSNNPPPSNGPINKSFNSDILNLSSAQLSALDDDDDEDEDDDDDDYDGSSGATNTGGGTTPTIPPVTVPVASRKFENITLVKPAYNTQSIYLINRKTSVLSDSDAEDNLACDPSKTDQNGLHKVQLKTKTANTLNSTSAHLIVAAGQHKTLSSVVSDDVASYGKTLDAFAGASGYVPPPTPTVPPAPTGPVPGTDASCLNNAFVHLAISANEEVLVAATAKRLFRLDMENLSQLGNPYAPFADSVDITHISLSADGSLIAVSTSETRGLSLVNSNTMTQAGWLAAPAEGQPELQQVKQAFFFDNHQQIAAIEGGSGANANKLHIIDSSRSNRPTLSQSIELSAPISWIAVSPDRKNLAAISTDNNLWFYKLSGSIELLERFSPVSQARQLVLQNDQALILDDTGEVIQTFNFGNRFGNAMLQVNNELTLARIMGVNSNRQRVNKDMFLPQTGADINSDILGVTINWTSSSEALVNPTTGKVTVPSQPQAVILDAKISGTYRGEPLTLTKSFQIRVGN